jgi:threonine aldolase
MNFASDNTTGVHPRIMAAMAAAAGGRAMPYGADDISRRVERLFAEVFERDCAVFLVATGAAANSLALAAMSPPWGAIYCHPGGHVNADECGAPEFYTGGAKLVAIPGAHGKVAAADIDRAWRHSGVGSVHVTQPAAVSLTQLTEAGTIYTPAELGAIGEVCRGRGLGFHVDGARFANAVAGSGRSPADLTWRAGVEALSFGATKNGAMAAEAVVFFDMARAATMGWRRKRAGQLWSKHRFLAAQMEAYLSGGLWLDCARHSNAMAARLAAGLAALPQAAFVHPVEGNEIFVRLPPPVLDGLQADGFAFYRWPGEDTWLVRLVAGYDTTPTDVDALLARARHHAAALRPA